MSCEVRITQQGKPRNYISYAMKLFVRGNKWMNEWFAVSLATMRDSQRDSYVLVFSNELTVLFLLLFVSHRVEPNAATKCDTWLVRRKTRTRLSSRPWDVPSTRRSRSPRSSSARCPFTSATPWAASRWSIFSNPSKKDWTGSSLGDMVRCIAYHCIVLFYGVLLGRVVARCYVVRISSYCFVWLFSWLWFLDALISSVVHANHLVENAREHRRQRHWVSASAATRRNESWRLSSDEGSRADSIVIGASQNHRWATLQDRNPGVGTCPDWTPRTQSCLCPWVL